MEDVVLVWLQLVFISQRCSGRSLSLVDCCPSTEKTWNEKERAALCNSHEVYHCMQTMDGKYAEFCARKTIVNIAKCPMTKEGRQIDDHVDCKQESEDCPQEGEDFISNELYRYPGCLSPCQPTEYNSREGSNLDKSSKTTLKNEISPSPSNVPASVNTMMSSEKELITVLSSEQVPVTTYFTSESLMVTESSAESTKITSDMLMLTVICSVGGLLMLFMVATCIVVWKMRRDMTVQSRSESGAMDINLSKSHDKLERGILPPPDTTATQKNPADTVYDYAYEDCRSLPPASVPNNDISSVGDTTDIHGMPYTYEAPVINHLYESLETLQMSDGYQKRRKYDILQCTSGAEKHMSSDLMKNDLNRVKSSSI